MTGYSYITQMGNNYYRDHNNPYTQSVRNNCNAYLVLFFTFDCACMVFTNKWLQADVSVYKTIEPKRFETKPRRAGNVKTLSCDNYS